LRRWYTNVLYPHSRNLKWNPLVGIQFIGYVTRHFAAVLYSGESRPTLVPSKPAYTSRQRLRIFAEVILIAGLQAGVYLAVGARWQRFIWASPIPILAASAFAMAYIWTNHYLHGLLDKHDPIAGSTSLIVHPIFDFLHSHFSYHTEHHVFPNMSSDFYPLVSELIERNFPGRLHRLPMGEAWRLLWLGEPHIRENG
jgi:fatty acid desaturase